MKTKKRKAGRPKLPKGEVKNVIAIRLTESEKRRYLALAEKAGESLSEWIQNTVSVVADQ